jgi:hypothetical protein
MVYAARKANVTKGVNILRHTFCSHLAVRRACAGHSGTGRPRDLRTTQRYMQLSPAALEAAIQLLDRRGNMVATQVSST